MPGFGKHPSFIIRNRSPWNGGPPLEPLRRALVTPVDLFFVRNHGHVPVVDAASYRLAVVGDVRRPLALTLDEIRKSFPARTLNATLQCAGNRRNEFAAVAPIPGEVPWGAEAIGTASWRGAALRDVLGAAEIQAGAAHVAFVGLDPVKSKEGVGGFGGSIPLEKALSPEVLLAYEMNGEALPPVHGSPLRVVVPGYIGARSVKWLASVTLQAAPSENFFQARAYRMFPPQVRAESADWAAGTPLGELSANAVICAPAEGERVPGPAVRVAGYAVAGGGQVVERVELSPDDGRTWLEARLLESADPFTWRFWEASLDLRPGRHRLAVRARDSGGNTQPAGIEGIWNFKGYMNNAWHRVTVHIAG